MRDPRPLSKAPDPRREPEGGSGGLRLGGALGPPAAGTRTCIRSPRASAEPLILRASPRYAAPALVGELAAGDRAGFFLLPGGPRAEGAGGCLGRRAGAAGCWGRGRLRPGREVERGRRGKGSSLLPVAHLVQREPWVAEAFPGVGWGIRPAPSLEAPAVAATSGACCPFGLRGRSVSPRGPGGKRQKVPRDTKIPLGGGGAAGAGG